MGSTPAVAAEIEAALRVEEERTVAIFTIMVHAAAISMMAVTVTTPEFPVAVVQRKDDDATISALRTVTDPPISIVGESLPDTDILELKVCVRVNVYACFQMITAKAYGVQLQTGAPSHVWQYAGAPALDADIPTGDFDGIDDIAGSIFAD